MRISDWSSDVCSSDRIRRYPQFPVLIDHLAEAKFGSAPEFVDVVNLARYDNVYMKLSGINHFATDGPFYESAITFTRWVIGSASCRERVCQYGQISVVAVYLKKKKLTNALTPQ